MKNDMPPTPIEQPTLDTLQDIVNRKQTLFAAIKDDEARIQGKWLQLFKTPAMFSSNAPASKRLVSALSSGWKLIDGFILGWKLYQRFKPKKR